MTGVHAMPGTTLEPGGMGTQLELEQ